MERERLAIEVSLEVDLAREAPARAHGPKHLNHHLPVLVRHPRQHGRPPQTDPPGIRKPGRRKPAQKSTRLNPSTRPSRRTSTINVTRYQHEEETECRLKRSKS